MKEDYSFYFHNKYGVTINAVLNCDGIIMAHKLDEGYDYKQTDILHAVEEFDYVEDDDDEETISVIKKLTLKTYGKVHISSTRLDAIKNALRDLVKSHRVPLNITLLDIDHFIVSNSQQGMKTLYELCVNEEPDD